MMPLPASSWYSRPSDSPRADLQAVPQERAEHHFVFQAFRLVDGDDLHQIAVRFQPQLRVLAAHRLPAAIRQPAQQRFRPGVGHGGLVQQFAQMQEIGQAAFPVGASEQPPGDALGLRPLPEHEAEAAFEPGVAIAGEAGHRPQQLALVAGQGQDGLRIAAHQFRGEGGEQAHGMAGLGDRQQHPLQLLRVRRGENALARELDTADAECSECLLDQAALGMAFHQHRDIAGEQAAAVHGDALGGAFAHQPRHLGGGGLHRPLPRLVAQQIAAVRVPRQAPDAQRRRARAGLAAVDEGWARLGAEMDLLVVDPGQDEAPGVASEQAVAGEDQPFDRALIVGQGMADTGATLGLQIGVQIGVAEAVDRLLGIAHQEQRPCAAAAAAASPALP